MTLAITLFGMILSLIGAWIESLIMGGIGLAIIIVGVILEFFGGGD
jgi:hypothetical protein